MGVGCWNPLVSAIYANISTSIKEPKHLVQLIKDIGDVDWYSASQDGLGELYEGLQEKNAGVMKSGAGQYSTPRPLIKTMLEVLKPLAGEVIQDHAAGTGRLPDRGCPLHQGSHR